MWPSFFFFFSHRQPRHKAKSVAMALWDGESLTGVSYIFKPLIGIASKVAPPAALPFSCCTATSVSGPSSPEYCRGGPAGTQEPNWGPGTPPSAATAVLPLADGRIKTPWLATGQRSPGGCSACRARGGLWLWRRGGSGSAVLQSVWTLTGALGCSVCLRKTQRWVELMKFESTHLSVHTNDCWHAAFISLLVLSLMTMMVLPGSYQSRFCLREVWHLQTLCDFQCVSVQLPCLKHLLFISTKCTEALSVDLKDFFSLHTSFYFSSCFVNNRTQIRFQDLLTRATWQFTILILLDFVYLSLSVRGITFVSVEFKAEG